MPYFHWLRRLATRRASDRVRRERPRAAFRPCLEGLEDRITPAGGLLDPTFGASGIVNLPATTDEEALAVAVQPDRRVVVAGQVARSNGYTSISVQRLNPDGSLDRSFNKTGSVTIQTGNNDYPRALALQPDGKILVGGYWSANKGSSGGLVARLNANGTLDTTFGNSRGLWTSSATGTVEGLAVLTDPAHPATVTGIVAAADGSANGTRCFEAVKLTPAGAPDTTFGSGGFAVFASLSGGETHGVAVAPSGEIYLAGYVNFGGITTNDGCLAAVTPAGVLDGSFGGGAGYVLIDPTGIQESTFNDVEVQTLTVNGQQVSRVVAAGYVVTPNQDGFVAAYTLGGALDTTFGVGGSFTYANPPGADTYSEFKSMTLEADGSIVVGGSQSYTDPGGTRSQQMLIGHLTVAGAPDTSFGTAGTGFVPVANGRASAVWGLAIDPTDGDILACGVSQNPHASAQAAIVRLTAP